VGPTSGRFQVKFLYSEESQQPPFMEDHAHLTLGKKKQKERDPKANL